MEPNHVIFVGPPIDDGDLLDALPTALAVRLRETNGAIEFLGGLHTRGACREPLWHSLRDAWMGNYSFHRLYPEVRKDDIPFAEDCMGDQFLLRDWRVVRLRAETGQVEPLHMDLAEFFAAANADPVEFLSLQPLLRYLED